MDTETINKKVEQIAVLFEEIKALNTQLSILLKDIVKGKWKTSELSTLRSAQSKLSLIIEKYIQALAIISNSINFSDYPKDLTKPIVHAQQNLNRLNRLIKARTVLRVIK